MRKIFLAVNFPVMRTFTHPLHPLSRGDLPLAITGKFTARLIFGKNSEVFKRSTASHELFFRIFYRRLSIELSENKRGIILKQKNAIFNARGL